MTKTYTTHEIINELKEMLDLNYDNDLASYLDVSKQSMYQYKNKVTPDIQQKIISVLLDRLKEENIKQ